MKRILLALAVLVLLVGLNPVQLAEAAPLNDTTYTVQPGDNLYRIAVRFGTTVDAIVAANGLSSTVIIPGQVLRIPTGGGSSTGGSTSGTTSPTATPAPSTGSSAPGGVYVVKPGDFLSAIARRFGTTYPAIMQANGLTSTVIYPGQQLTIPGQGSTGGSTGGSTSGSTGGTTAPVPTAAPSTGTTGGVYTVQPGDSLYKIAVRFNTTWPAIQAANSLTTTTIFVGQRLVIPGQGGSTGGSAPSPTATPRPSTGTIAPPVVAPNAGSGFGLGGQVQGFGPDAEAAMRTAKMTWVKRQVVWGPGASADSFVALIADSHARGFKVLLSVTGHAGELRPEYFAEYAQFVGRLAGAGADAIEIWNEQNIEREGSFGLVSPEAYTSLLQQSYNAIKAANPGTMVVSGAPAPTGFFGGCGPNGCDDLPYLQRMVNAGALNYMDCVGIHYNEGVVPPTATSGDPRGNSGHYTRYYTSMVNTYLAAVNNQRPLCFTEIGYLSGEEWGALPGGFLWKAPYNLTVAEHASYLAQAAQLAAQSGRVRMFIIFNVDIKTYGDDPQAGYAIIRPNGGCPACDALAAAFP